MKKYLIGKSNLQSSRIVHGCMRIVGDGSPQAREKGKRAVRAAVDIGINHFDHADIYAGGQSEMLFGEVLKESPDLRDQLIITSKCGIRRKDNPVKGDPGRYDFSRDYILKSVDGSLSRLGTDHLDLLLLHRPDYLFKPEEVAGAFDTLKQSGKVRAFGVSNFRPSQVSLLQASCDMPLIANQVEINIHRIAALDDGTLNQCLELGISPEAWCPLGGVAYPAWGNTFTPEDEERIRSELQRQSEIYDAEPWVVILAWILAHPSNIFTIIGTTTPERVAMSTKALELDYTREDWYRLLEARNGYPVP